MSKKTPKHGGRRNTRRPQLTPDEFAGAIDKVVMAAKQKGVPARVVVDAFADAMEKKYMQSAVAGPRKGLLPEMRSYLENLRAAYELPELVDAAVLAAGRTVFSTDGAVGMWLATPARFADGRRPLELLRTPKGKRKVIAILTAIAHGNVI